MTFHPYQADHLAALHRQRLLDDATIARLRRRRRAWLRRRDDGATS